MSAYTPGDLLDKVIRPAIAALGEPPNPDLEAQLLRTCAQETHLGMQRVQEGGGPALGIFQIEPATCNDIWQNWLMFRPTMRTKVEAVLGDGDHVAALVDNDIYSCMIARLKYLRSPLAIPPAADIEAQAGIYLHVFNAGGKATAQQFIANALALQGTAIV